MNEGNRSDGGRKRHERGIFERPGGSGVWWVRYHDEHGREHRKKVGPKRLAVEFYRKVKNEIFEPAALPRAVPPPRRSPGRRDRRSPRTQCEPAASTPGLEAYRPEVNGGPRGPWRYARRGHGGLGTVQGAPSA